MHPLVNKTRKSSHEENINHAAKAAIPPVQRRRIKPEHARLSAATAAGSDSKRPTRKLGQMMMAVAVDFSAAIGQLIALISSRLHTARRALSRLCQRCVEVSPSETDSRKDHLLAGTAAQ